MHHYSVTSKCKYGKMGVLVSKKVIMKKYVALTIIGVCLAGSALFIVNAKKNNESTAFQDNYNGFGEVFSDSPETMKNEILKKQKQIV